MILYISDLDGTLLNSQQELTKKTTTTINTLVNKGLNFTVATARSLDSASYIINALNLKHPVILHNGVFIYDPIKKENIVSYFMHNDEASEILDFYHEAGVYPFVYTLTDTGERKAYYKTVTHHGEKIYLNDRLKRGDRRFLQVDKYKSALKENIIGITVIGESRMLDPLCTKLKSTFSLSVKHAVDIYSGATWLELNHKNANKKDAVIKLKKLLQAEKIICFGDHLNDLPMFEAADEKYAVNNAQDALKEIATDIIGSNNENGVALFLASS